MLVFGFGSLVNHHSLSKTLGRPVEDLAPAWLFGYRRLWNVAVENHRATYNHYLDPETGERPPVHITFLNIEEAADAKINGVIFEVSERELGYLDEREHNYDRVDVTAGVQIESDRQVFTYIGKDSSIDCFHRGKEKDLSVISAGYAQIVAEGFQALGHDFFSDYHQTTQKPQVPLKNLQSAR